MAIKRKNKALENVGMASMTDVIFLLLIFFMVLSTLVVPNAIRVNLPSSKSTVSNETIIARITLTKSGECHLAIGKNKAIELSKEQLAASLADMMQKEGESLFVALYADEEVPYREVVDILNITNELGLQLLLATKALKEAPKKN